MALNCVYHPTKDMRVVEDDVKAELLATGEWYDHPNKAKEAKEKKNERQIRRQPRKRFDDGENPPQQAGSGAQCEG